MRKAPYEPNCKPVDGRYAEGEIRDACTFESMPQRRGTGIRVRQN